MQGKKINIYQFKRHMNKSKSRFSIFFILFMLLLLCIPLPIYADTVYRVPFLMPLEGEIITGFRESYFDQEKNKYFKHTGIDIEGKSGQIVIASGNGIVTYCGFSPVGGRTLVIKHNDRIRTTYLNLLNIYVPAGKYVRQGETIACIGATDDPSDLNYHLHFGVIYDDKYIDPCDLLKIDYGSISKFLFLEYIPDDFRLSYSYKTE
jgi:murein DD-endopeptidase MepM/ murein hydrolase activator NlpD